MAGAKRLLVLTRHPESASFRQRVASYVAPLGEQGIAAEVVTLSRSTWVRRRQLLRAGEFDGVLIQKKTLTPWDAAFLRRAGRPLVYDFDDAILYKARSIGQRPDRTRLRRFRRTMALASGVIAGNNTLADHARRAGATRVAVIPTGLDVRRYGPADKRGPAGFLRLVWIGSRSTLKQLRQLRPVLEAIARALPDCALRVIADAPLAIAGMEVENLPWARDTEARLLAESDVGIAPLPDTPFTRGKCGFKVLQYMASGLPVIASPVGVNADYVAHEQTGLLAGAAAEWVAAAETLASDPGRRRRMGAEGRRRAARFDFSALAPQVCQVVAQTLE